MYRKIRFPRMNVGVLLPTASFARRSRQYRFSSATLEADFLFMRDVFLGTFLDSADALDRLHVLESFIDVHAFSPRCTLGATKAGYCSCSCPTRPAAKKILACGRTWVFCASASTRKRDPDGHR